MTTYEIDEEYHRAALDYSYGRLTFDQFKQKIQHLDSLQHDHKYCRNGAGERSCACGAKE